MELIDGEGNATPTGPVGPAGIRWTYSPGYSRPAQYSADLFRMDGSDLLGFLKVGGKVPYEAKDGTLNLAFNREELDEVIAELTWLRDNWGEVGRGA